MAGILRALASIAVVGALYVGYIFISGDKIRPVFVMIAIAVPTILTILELLRRKSDLHSEH